MAGDPQVLRFQDLDVHRSDPPIGLCQGQLPHTSLGQGTYCKKIVGVMPDGPWPKTMVPAVSLGFVDPQVEDPQQSLIHQGIHQKK
jgi:hypothetical protein